MDSFLIAYWACVIIGTSVFALKLLFMFVAGIEDTLGFDSDASSFGVLKTISDFKSLSINSLTGFFMVFGWTGLTTYDQFQLDPFLSLVLALLAGGLSIWITARIFYLASELNSSGHRFSINATIGKEAIVYAQIPAEGRGRVQIVIDGITHELDAISEEGEAIDTQSAVLVQRVLDSRTVAVKQTDSSNLPFDEEG